MLAGLDEACGPNVGVVHSILARKGGVMRKEGVDICYVPELATLGVLLLSSSSSVCVNDHQ